MGRGRPNAGRGVEGQARPKQLTPNHSSKVRTYIHGMTHFGDMLPWLFHSCHSFFSHSRRCSKIQGRVTSLWGKAWIFSSWLKVGFANFGTLMITGNKWHSLMGWDLVGRSWWSTPNLLQELGWAVQEDVGPLLLSQPFCSSHTTLDSRAQDLGGGAGQTEALTEK